ncbi:MAG: hypothetical protein A2017_15985 [Lentisphaerae bacterium GWF2_44_16]|nr:MAG: hypothetical protein A2017_15985 [Lentisphaerae bacterium GWF2_44_16]
MKNFISRHCRFVICMFFAAVSLSAQISETEMPVKIVLFPCQEAVISAKVSTNVSKYNLKEGEAFSKGDTIVLLDDRQYKQNYLKANAIFKFAAENCKRNKEMFDKNAIGSMDLEQSKVEKESAEANMKLAEIDLLSCEIKAPFNGRLTKKIVRENEFVNAGQAIMEIIDDNKLLADMHLPSKMRKKLTIGDEMEFTIDETGSSCKGKIYEISGRIDFGSRTFGIRVLIDNADKKLNAGMSGTLKKKER